jgi:hypothetical protein
MQCAAIHTPAANASIWLHSAVFSHAVASKWHAAALNTGISFKAKAKQLTKHFTLMLLLG